MKSTQEKRIGDHPTTTTTTTTKTKTKEEWRIIESTGKKGLKSQ